MLEFRWKGNVRQLKNVVESMVVMDIDDMLEMDDLPPDLLDGQVVTKVPIEGSASEGNGSISELENSSLIGKSLKEIERLNLILDATHLCDQSFWETMKNYNGSVWASHNNCRSLVNHNRQFADEQIQELINRKAVIGIPLDAWMMVPNWVRGESTPESMGVTLQQMVDNIDHICQLAGNALHVGIGTDLDGGFGKEQGPLDLDTIADLQKVPHLLSERGYALDDIENIMNGNFLHFLQNTL